MRSAFAVAVCVMIGCTSPVQPPDDAGSDTGIDSGSTNQVCAALVAREQMCNRPQCEIDDLQRACPSFAAHLRPEASAALVNCARSAPSCPTDAAASGPLDACFAMATSGLSPTQAQLDAANAICSVCPGAGGDPMATAAACQASFFQRTDAGDNGAGGLLLIFDDTTARTVGTSCAGSVADAGSTCAFGVALCTIVAVGIPLGTSCTDGG
jgi:hypothetical protein